MKEFFYLGNVGNKQTNGIITSKNINEASVKLSKADIKVILIKSIKPKKEKIFWDLLDRISMLIRQGYNITDALHLLEDEDDEYIRECAIIMLRRLEMGNSIKDTLKMSFHSLPSEVSSIIDAGEKAGQIERACSLLLKNHKSSVKRNRQMKMILTYPLIVLISSFFVAWILIDLVLPGLKASLPDQSELPYASQVILSLSGKFGNFIEILIWSIVFTLLIILIAIREKNIKLLIDKLLLGFPLTRYFVISFVRAHFFEVLKLCLESRLPLLQSISLAAATTHNSILNDRCNKGMNEIQQGISFSLAMKSTGLFNRRELSQITAAERSSQLEKTVAAIAISIEEERQNFVSIISQITGPLFILIIGSFVFTIAMVIVMPMIAMQTQLETIIK